MLGFLRKDVTVQLRDYRELALLVLMPLLLIAILGFALGGLMSTGVVSLDASAALVVLDDEAAGRREFDAALAAADLPAAAKLQLVIAARAIQPVAMLRDVLQSEELAEFVTVTESALPEAEARLAANDIKAVIVVPAGYTYDLLSSMLLGERPGAELRLSLSDASPISASVLNDVVSGFASEVSLRTAMAQAGMSMTDQAAGSAATGGIERVSGGRSMPAFAYYTFGMAVMFMLYVAGALASRAHLELSSHTFDRILVSGAKPLTFLLSKVGAGAVIVILQFAFLLLVSSLLFGVAAGQPASFWWRIALVLVPMALCVGALAGLLTALAFRLDNKSVGDVFTSVVVFIFALLGGSFLPLDEMAPALAAVGRWLPNGGGLSSFLSIGIGAPAATWLPNVIKMLVVTVLLILVSLLLFPRRRNAR